MALLNFFLYLCKIFWILFQARINQKEETIAKYQELLNQARDDMMEMNKRHEQDLKNMQEKIHMNTDAAFNKFKDAARELITKQHVQPASSKQVGYHGNRSNN